jgi:phage FluMu gp28-like protein
MAVAHNVPRKGVAKAASRPQATPLLVSPAEMLFPYQRRFNDDRSRFKVGVFSRQTGKSTGTSHEAVEDAYKSPGTTWVCMSAGERQALEWLRKAIDWAECYQVAVEDYAEDRAFAEALLNKAEIRLANTSRIISIPANPSTARGYSANVVLDEFDYHEDQDAIWRAIFPSITNPMGGSLADRFRALRAGNKPVAVQYKLRVVSTYNGQRMVYKLMQDKAWSHHLVTIHDAVRDGLGVDVEELRAGLGDPEAWAQEYECIPMDASNVLLPYDLIAQAESADATEFNTPPETRHDPALVLGIDFGRQNDPSVCWMLQRVWDLLWTREVLVLDKMDTPSQQEILGARIRAASRVCFDYTGPGVGLGDYLVQEHGEWRPEAHRFGKIELCTFTAPFKRELFPRLRRQFEAPTKIRIPISRDIREDLHSMRQIVKNGQYGYDAPRTREGHSDRCTALALAVRAAGDTTGAVGISVR